MTSRLTKVEAHNTNTTLGVEEGSLIGKHYRERLVRRGRQPASVRNFDRSWILFAAYCHAQGITPERIEPWQMEQFFTDLDYARTTKGLILCQVRAAYRYARERGLVDRDPTIDVELPRQADKVIRILTADQLKEIKANCHNERQWLMFHLYAYTGCRKNEIRELHWDNVSMPNNTLFVIGKGGKARLVPIHPALGEVLGSYKPVPGKAVISNAYGRPYNYTYYDDILRSFGKDVTFHDFRRTVASSLDANGVEEGLIMRIMGWAPKTVFDRHYRNVAPERLQNAILKLYADCPL